LNLSARLIKHGTVFFSHNKTTSTGLSAVKPNSLQSSSMHKVNKGMMHEQLKYNLSFIIKSKQSYFFEEIKTILLQTARKKLDLNISPAAVCL
jgi:hypothetical protein